MPNTENEISSPLVVAVIGSGPSGFYAAEALLKSDMPVKINMIEKLPTPFGLVRYGVAPDHPKLKQVTLVFDKISQNPDFRFFGNIEVGSDVTLNEIKETHDAVIFCTGADRDRELDIPGENLLGSHTATEFVAWYNGHPDYKDHEFDLSQEVAVIIGQGNVAADVSRILSKPVDDLRHTDIATHAVEQLAESKIRDVHVVGRRGPAQAKFTSKELKELGGLSGCGTSVSQTGFVLDEEDLVELDDPANENAAKCVGHFKAFYPGDPKSNTRTLTFHFRLSPIEMIGSNGKLRRISFDQNTLTGAPFSRVAEPNGQNIEIDCGLCFRSIGYRGQPVSHAPFDNRRGVIPNKQGQVIEAGGHLSAKLYTSGWIKRGPSGVIGTNRADSVETVAALIKNFTGQPRSHNHQHSDFMQILSHKRLKPVFYNQWKMIDAAEIARGKRIGKTREKIVSVNQMLAIAG